MKIKKLMVKLTAAEWEPIKASLIEQYGKSTAISWVMRRELGFVCRAVQEPNINYKTTYYLDFWDEADMTMFLMRWA